MSTVQRWTLPSQLVCLYRRDATMPLAAATLLLRVGSRKENAREAGLNGLMMDLLTSGTRRKNARRIADVMESIGGSLAAQGGEDYSEIDWLVPAAHGDRALDLMAEVLQEPVWPAQEVEKERRHVIADLRSRSDSLFNVAYDTFRERLFSGHPYARPVEGRETSVERFQRADLARWHKTHIRPDQAILSMIGPWPEKEARRKVERALGGWTSGIGASEPRRIGETARPETPRLRRPDAVSKSARFQQAYLLSGTNAPPLGHAGVVPLKLWTMILGGGMSSPLFVKLREERGLAYEVSCFYPAKLDAGAWVVYMGLPGERLPEAQGALTGLLKEIADRGPTPAQLLQAKRSMQSTYVMDCQTRRRQAWYAAWWEFLGRPPDYDKHYLKRIAAVTLRDVREAGRAVLKQPRLTVKVVPKK